MVNSAGAAVNSITCGDCLDVMKDIPAGTVDMVLCDLPYGTTDLKWDNKLPFPELWSEFLRVGKTNAAFIFTAQGGFGADLIQSARRIYRYSLVWEKSCPLGFLNARIMPLRAHEDIHVFYRRKPTYNPQMEPGKPYVKNRNRHTCAVYGDYNPNDTINLGGRGTQNRPEVYRN